MMNKANRQQRNELEEQMKRARNWMSAPWRTDKETEKWYSEYERLVNKLNEIEREMWGPIPW
jgi:hypothetical protein